MKGGVTVRFGVDRNGREREFEVTGAPSFPPASLHVRRRRAVGIESLKRNGVAVVQVFVLSIVFRMA